MAPHIIAALATQGLQQWNIICIEWPKLIFHAPDSVRHSNSNLWFLLLNRTEESRSFPGWIYFARFVAAEIDSSKMVLKKVNLPPFDNTSATSYLCNIFLGQDTMSRMGLPVWLDNKHFAHFGHCIDRAISVTRVHLCVPIFRHNISKLLGSLLLICTSWSPGGLCVFYLFSGKHVQDKYTDKICSTNTKHL